MIRCDACDAPTAEPENEYGEHICDNCQQNRAESAWERHCEDFHDGGCTRFVSLLDRQRAAQRAAKSAPPFTRRPMVDTPRLVRYCCATD